MVQRDDLLALELVQPARLLADVVDDGRDFGVRVQLQREGIRKHAAVGRIGAAVVDGDQRQLVGSRALQRGVGDADGQRVGGGGGRAVQAFFQALVAFDAFFDDVFGFALAPGQLDAVDAAVGVDVLQVVDEAAEKAGAARRIRANAVALQRKVLFRLGLGGESGGAQAERQSETAGESGFKHRAGSPCGMVKIRG